ncbi:hypothetical protein GA0115240_13743 [Streptomyces sp. DvalAA-14]|uniref:hypothetical protein n=1 Tax=unclassified Streptomyces TaxID=2593676 RepID=UPI00081B6E03|nr:MULTISPECIES: hypothetical protein [unclassified Streptomyces]MYS22003.1 hypothetical protein [Streptomyces sp. SID4948]SCE06393.1 hypothetical protein GA0115240_13743 [Streptomyces sp. DvalAA-14]
MGRSLRWHTLSSLVIAALLAGAGWLWGDFGAARAVRTGVIFFVLMTVAGVLMDVYIARKRRGRS